jgi:RNA polymerase sigma-70 factor (ECF subfamily)
LGNLGDEAAFYLFVNPRTALLSVPPPGTGQAALASAPERPWWERSGPRPTQRPDAGDLDETTLARAQSGDRDALEDFVRFYEERVHAFLGRSLIGKSDVDDLAQEVFLRALRALPRFERRDARLSTWIFSIAVRLLLDRRRQRRRWFSLFDEERTPSTGRTPEDSASDRETLTAVERVLAELSAEQRMALALLEIHGLTCEEVARAMGTSVATVKTRVFRARRVLRRVLGSACDGTEGGQR